MIKITMEFEDFAAVEAFARKNASVTTIAAELKGAMAHNNVLNNQSSRVSTSDALAAYVEQAKQEGREIGPLAKDLAKLPAVKAEAPKEPEAVSTPTPSESAAPGVTYDELKSSIMKLVAINPNHMRAVCEQFGVKTFQGTDAATWAKAKDVIDAKVAELKGA